MGGRQRHRKKKESPTEPTTLDFILISRQQNLNRTNHAWFHANGTNHAWYTLEFTIYITLVRARYGNRQHVQSREALWKTPSWTMKVTVRGLNLLFASTSARALIGPSYGSSYTSIRKVTVRKETGNRYREVDSQGEVCCKKGFKGEVHDEGEL